MLKYKKQSSLSIDKDKDKKSLKENKNCKNKQNISKE